MTIAVGVAHQHQIAVTLQLVAGVGDDAVLGGLHRRALRHRDIDAVILLAVGLGAEAGDHPAAHRPAEGRQRAGRVAGLDRRLGSGHGFAVGALTRRALRRRLGLRNLRRGRLLGGRSGRAAALRRQRLRRRATGWLPAGIAAAADCPGTVSCIADLERGDRGRDCWPSRFAIGAADCGARADRSCRRTRRHAIVAGACRHRPHRRRGSPAAQPSAARPSAAARAESPAAGPAEARAVAHAVGLQDRGGRHAVAGAQMYRACRPVPTMIAVPPSQLQLCVRRDERGADVPMVSSERGTAAHRTQCRARPGDAAVTDRSAAHSRGRRQGLRTGIATGACLRPGALRSSTALVDGACTEPWLPAARQRDLKPRGNRVPHVGAAAPANADISASTATAARDASEATRRTTTWLHSLIRNKILI